MANNVPQAPQRPDVPEQNLQLSGDVFIPAQVSAGQVPILNRSELKLPSDFKVFWMLLKVQITMIWVSRGIIRDRISPKKSPTTDCSNSKRKGQTYFQANRTKLWLSSIFCFS